MIQHHLLGFAAFCFQSLDELIIKYIILIFLFEGHFAIFGARLISVVPTNGLRWLP